MKRYLVPLLATSLFAATLSVSAQSQDSQDFPSSATQNRNNNSVADCSDPLQAQTPQCMLQNPGTTPQFPTTQSTPSPGLLNQQPLNPSYTDNEILARQNAARIRLWQTLPPEPLTEFQKFVASTTGQVLPIYGANLFRQVPSTFAPLDLGPVPPDYTIGPGDELRIRIWGQVNQRADLRVDRTGDIYLPQVGQIHVANIPYSSLDEHLRTAVGRIYRNFDLSAEVGQIRSVQVYVAGAASRPGVYTVSSLSTLVDALFASGGPSASGSLRDIELRRGATVVTHFDLYSLLVHGDKTHDATLQSGDVIFIPPVGPQVAMTGSVRSPAIYELRPDEPLSNAVADAGGVSAVAAEARVSIERIDEHRDRHAMEVAWDAAGLATPLADGDLVQVLSIIPRYQKTVILRGNTANPGRFAWKPGMHVSDLIPDKEALITRNYWWKRAQLGLPEPEFEPLQNFPGLVQPMSPLDLPRSRFLGQRANGNGNSRSGAEAPNGGSAPGNENNSDQTNNYDQTNGSGYNQNSGYDQYNDDDQSGNPVAGVGENGTPDQSQRANQRLNPTQRAGAGTLAAEQGDLLSRSSSTMRTRVGSIAPEIDWNYAVIERQDPDTLKTVLIPFDLGGLVLEHDVTQDLALQPGDVVTVFSQADIQVPIGQQTKFVRLDGEFVHAGVYTVTPGETLRELVARAGGFTPNAYLYGSEFTRESTRAVQQSRMDEYIQTLEMQMERGNLALASSATSSSLDLANGASAQTSEQQMLSRLRQMRATGRIVLELQGGSAGVNALPDITLENGDHFIVPPRPASVNVVGSVFDQNSFLYQGTRRTGDYLHLAGGPNRDADRKQIFIIRADGSVISRTATSGVWGDEFDHLRMNPGDTIVVPEKGFKPSALRGFLDWSQLFSQFALGAAALSVIQ
ncbi:MAG TPA: SLBB domain-containing protein [Acidobacteriaceae bacterium]|jgi:protein involved in polysaccharide export with SLBB domain|nr:SLBB domain-containing protein [Acidobacteriaceae bacterium]